MTSILKEFRDFLLRGNLVLLAVAFVMGVAFAALVNAFVNDLVAPVLGAILGKTYFGALTFTINHSTFLYGAFISSVIAFVATAAGVFFFIVKPVDLLTKKDKADDEPSDEERRHQELLGAIKGLAR
jgi:large conductance mechanosensitive channel